MIHSSCQPCALPRPVSGTITSCIWAPREAADGLWKLKDGSETELWKGSEGAVVSAPAVSPDGTQICFVVRREGRGAPSPDGLGRHRCASRRGVTRSPRCAVLVAGREMDRRRRQRSQANPLFKVPWMAETPVRLVDGVSSVISNPVWSPDGRFILYSEGQGSATVRLQASRRISSLSRCRKSGSGTRAIGTVFCPTGRVWSFPRACCGCRTSRCWILPPVNSAR